MTVALTLALGGCARTPEATSAGPAGSASSGATGVASTQARRIDTTSMPVEVEGGPESLQSRSDEHVGAPYEHAAWPELTDDPAFTKVLADSTEQARRAFREDAPTASGALQPSFNQSWALALASDDVLAVTLARREFMGASGGTSYVTYVRHDGRTDTGAALLSEAGKAQAVEQTVAALRSAGQRTWDAQDRDSGAILDTAVLDPAGDLVLIVSEGTAMPYSAGAWSVTIPAAQATPLLSDTGRAAQDGARGGRPVAPPADDAATVPPPSAATTATGGESAEPPAAPTTQPTTQPTTPAPAPTAGTSSPAPGAVDCSVARCVALTFDDGPGPYTNELLDNLKAAGARATFFTVGRAVRSDPATVKRAAAEGHAIGVHTWDHPDLTRLTAAEARRNIERGTQAVEQATGTRPTLLRPPYGAFVKGRTPDGGLAVINWDVDTQDWKNRSATTTTQRAVAGAHPGAIILMHDIHRSSVQAVPGLVAQLKAKGYTLVTVPELLGTPRPGTVYYSRPA